MSTTRHLYAFLQLPNADRLRMAYLDHLPASQPKGTVLLIHGFPQTSYQFRHVLPLLAAQGYRCIAPDYRGAGGTSKDCSDFRKSTMAGDMIALLDHLEIRSPVHVIGHDIGGMVAFAMASRYPDRVRSVNWGECPLPGTEAYRSDRTDHAVQQFHFIFHCVPDLPEALVAGKERIYLSHFFSKITYNLAAFSDGDIDHYAHEYSQPGAMRCGFGVYRAFEQDADENLKWVQEHGKCKVPSMVLSGEESRYTNVADDMVREVTDSSQVEVGLVPAAFHYLAEENPKEFAAVALDFMAKH